MNNNWKGIAGQNSVKKILDKIIDSSKIPHAFLFCGPDGVGKDFIAVRFAQILNEKYALSENKSHLIESIGNLNEPYVKYIFPLPRGKNETDSSGPIEKLSNDEIQILQEELNKKIKNLYYKVSIPRANNIKISSIRDIKKFLSINFEDISYRIVLISDAHLMNEESQNALLKNLEEPPEGVVFILSTPFPNLLRETIKSRCWTINFQPLLNDEIEIILKDYFEFDKKLAGEIAPFSNGSVNTALKLNDYDFNLLKEKTILILRYSFGRKFNSALKEFSAFLSDGNTEAIRLIISMIVIWLNDIQKYLLGLNEYYFSDYEETLMKFTKRFPDIKLNEIVYKMNRLSSLFKFNINPTTVVLMIVYELAALTTPAMKTSSF